MAARDPNNGGEKPRGPGIAQGFNSPFHELGASLRKRLPVKPRASSPVPPSVRPLVASPGSPISSNHTAPVPPGASAQAVSKTINEAEAFAEATRGVSRIEPKSRVRTKERADFELIAAGRRADLDDLASAAGFDVAFLDGYVRGRADGVSRETLSKLEKGCFSIAAHLDLHGMVLEDARAAVDDFLKEQQRLGHRCVLLVTGKGKNSPGQQGVLREKVPQWLARGPSARRVLAFVSARPCDGGIGALYVLMRSSSSRKNRIGVEFGGVGSLEP